MIRSVLAMLLLAGPAFGQPARVPDALLARAATLVVQQPDTPAPPLADPPAIRELTPLGNRTQPGDPLPLTPGRMRWFSVTGYTGSVTWEMDSDTVVGFKEVPTTKSSAFFWVEGAAEPDFLDLPAQACIVWAKKEGLAKLSAFGVIGGKAKRIGTVTLLVGAMPPVPPAPVPVPPGPTPPAPVPEPTDPLWPAMKEAYRVDIGLDKATSAQKLASVWRMAATGTVNDPALKTIGDLYGAISKAGGDLVPLPKLLAVRQLIASDLDTKLGVTRAVVLTDAFRAQCVPQFQRISALLEALAK